MEIDSADYDSRSGSLCRAQSGTLPPLDFEFALAQLQSEFQEHEVRRVQYIVSSTVSRTVSSTLLSTVLYRSVVSSMVCMSISVLHCR